MADLAGQTFRLVTPAMVESGEEIGGASVTTATKVETRRKRIDQFIAMLEKHEKLYPWRYEPDPIRIVIPPRSARAPAPGQREIRFEFARL